jgi:hypothetical protein
LGEPRQDPEGPQTDAAPQDPGTREKRKDGPPHGADNFPVRLLGNHNNREAADCLLTEVIRHIVEGWPPPPFRISGRDEGKTPGNFYLTQENTPGAAFRKAFTRLLRRCGIRSGRGPAVYRRELTATEVVHESVLPNGRDRRVTALTLLTGRRPLLYRFLDSVVRPRPRRVPLVHLYLDVSGSMAGCLPYLTAACREPFRKGELKVFAFSTVVSEVHGSDLTQAPMANTLGTDINAVLAHAVSIPAKKRPKAVLIVTDGYVGPARENLRSGIAKIRVVAALTHPGHEADLKPWVSELHHLPKP